MLVTFSAEELLSRRPTSRAENCLHITHVLHLLKRIKSGTKFLPITAAKESDINNNPPLEQPLPNPIPPAPGEGAPPFMPLIDHYSLPRGDQPPQPPLSPSPCCSGRQGSTLLVILFPETHLTTETHPRRFSRPWHWPQKALTLPPQQARPRPASSLAPASSSFPGRTTLTPGFLSSPPGLPPSKQNLGWASVVLPVHDFLSRNSDAVNKPLGLGG